MSGRNERLNSNSAKLEDDKVNNTTSYDFPIEQRTRKIIQAARKQLDQMIQDLDNKIRRRIEINESKFLVAYKNNLDKITRQLKVIKETYDAHQRKFSADNAIVSLVKQCTLFRQEAMRLHDQLEDALSQAEVYKRKSEILQKEMKQSDQLIKNLMHSNKKIEAERLRLASEQKMKEQKMVEIKSKISQLEGIQQRSQKKAKITGLSIKIPKTLQTTDKNQWVQNDLNVNTNKKLTKLTQNSSVPHYLVFQKKFDFEIQISPKQSSVKQRSKTRNKTCSTLNYNQSRKKIEANPSDIQTNRMRKQNQDEQDIYQQFMRKVDKFKMYPKNQACQLKLISQNIQDFLNCETDVKNLCLCLFPNSKLIEVAVDRQSKTERKIKSAKMKTLTYLSSQLMKKFQLSKTNLQKTYPQNNLHLSSDELDFINKRSKINQEGGQKIQEKVIGSEKRIKLKKMNQSFKRKTAPNRSVLSFVQRSARLRMNNSNV